MHVAKTISQRRKAVGITQKELAEMAAVSLGTVKDLERGEGNPSLKTLERLCAVLGLEIDFKIRKVEL